MKLIKKIAAIMFAFMMVVSMSCNVKADEGTTPTPGETGTITINNAIPEQTYTIYKILDLESYSSKEENGKETGNFAYKPSSEWESFIKGENVKDKYFTFEGEYVSWKENANPATFAKLALDYAKQNSSIIKTFKVEKASAASAEQATTTVTFSVLDLGYYLVDSSVGTLCSLDTTKPDSTIEEKNGVPSVDKKVSSTETGNYDTSNTAGIGDTVYFQTTITAQPGAQNYVLHDKMTKGLTLKNDSIVVKKGESPVATSDYTLKTSGFIDGCTFEIVFVQTFCDGLQKDEKITVTYSATLNANAVIGNDANTNTNKTLLSYGDSQKTTEVTTNTKTFKMDVFKYTENRNDKTKKDGLADAVFTLKKVGKTNTINFVKETPDEINGDIYRVANTGDANITTNKSGKFTIKGLSAGTYKLEEAKQPAGYNKLSGPVTVVIDENGKVTVDGVDADPVKVENKTGTVLPSTGGAGTTMIYLIGGALVLGSGVVLATKRRVKNK
mgnify:CR=1 FL=1